MCIYIYTYIICIYIYTQSTQSASCFVIAAAVCCDVSESEHVGLFLGSTFQELDQGWRLLESVMIPAVLLHVARVVFQ